ncbi:RNA-dependent ATPase rok1 [Coemansia spiralis]|uniref:RNA helicase n=2 Tax=Coemansia TaxID=4863 RepID=A0A9W8GAC2_9FUNG|nr:RNA-dependent ATPase rok1 [Coemansia umbellata]KAJ2624955.1 RNA-dependent ATPase rok1 [Coemansia sp. RSA 1358]KAJ2679137.1 RNA-dependent ATPase rok1 [Coemansia spiralis]
MDFFKLLGTGAKFDKARFKEDISVFKPSRRVKHETVEVVDTVPKELDFFGDHGRQKQRKDNTTAVPATQLSGSASRYVEEEEDHSPFQSAEEVGAYLKRHRIKVTGSDIPHPVKSFEMLCKEHNFQPFVLRNLQKLGFKQPTPVQMQAIPIAVHRRDLIANAPTGSGKTLAFLLSILHQVHTEERVGYRAVVVSPTRELATQIHDHLRNLTAGRKLKTCLMTKPNAAMQAQDPSMRQKFDILVTTPLRLVHAIQNSEVDLSHVRTLILDEADTLMEKGFLEQVDEILAACSSSNLQISLFSATMPSSIEQMANTIMKDPIRIIVGTQNAATETIDQKLVFVGQETGKLIELRNMITKGFKPPCLIFVQSIERAKELFHELIFEGINVEVIHSERTQTQRNRIIQKFRSGDLWVLICTELMARGIDFKGVNLVINYDFPQSTQSYIHRIGRTGRAGRLGKAITYFTKEDAPYLKTIVNVMRESGCEVPEWMLQLKNPKKNDKKKLKKAPVERDSISTTPKYDLKRQKHRQQIIEQSKAKKHKEQPAIGNGTAQT